MATTSHSNPLARLSRIGLALGIGSTQPTRNNSSKGEDDSYIPYNGPYESPTGIQQIRGYWDDEKVHNVYNQISPASNGRKYSNASRVTLSNILTEPRRRFGRLRQNSTPPPRTSYVGLDQGGGVGGTPVPVHRTPSQSGSSPKRRDSVFRASFAHPHKSFPRSDYKHEKTRSFGASTDNLAPSAVTSPSVYEQASSRSRSNSAAVQQRHPYANASPYLGQTSTTQATTESQKSEHIKFPRKKVPAHLRPSSRASILKASRSTPDLRAASRPAMHLKTKTNWLSAETWCDAFMLPRPRFLLRHMDEDLDTPYPRLVSPAGSIISGPIEPSAGPRSLEESQPLLGDRTSGPTNAVLARVIRDNPPPFRPRSFALDDLALPSPIPSLLTVLADGQTLQNERQMWHDRATKSIGNKRTRSLSRSRSLGKTRKPSQRQPPTGTFEFLAERTLLGHQAIPSVVHTTANPFADPSQTVSAGGLATRSFGSTFPRLRSKSHGHSNSAGTILDGPGHRRKESVTSILRRARSTATGLCVGADGISNPPDVLDTSTEGNTRGTAISDKLRGMTSPDSVFTSPLDQSRTSPDRGLVAPPHQGLGVSPTPSSQTQPIEGIGIAISLPPSSEEHPIDEPITLPAHPYAQGGNNHHRAPTNITPQLPETVHRRQPIVHPYAIRSTHPATSSPQWFHRDQVVSPARKMFAEIAPGHLREIRPEEIQYSPYIEEAPRVFIPTRATAVGRDSADPLLRRGSDTLRMGDALSLSLAHNHRRSSSTDSGIGASEDHHPYGPQPERTAPSRSNAFPSRQVREVLSAANDHRDDSTSHDQWLEPPPIFLRTASGSSDPTSLRTASSGQINPSVFSHTLTPLRPLAESSGSSPGLSNDSSPPLTPRPLGRLDDLERFQDLFYNPIANRSQSPELLAVDTPVATEDIHFATSPVDLARSRSRLTTLVRQLSVDLYELRNGESIPEDDDRLGGLGDEPSRDPMTSAGSVSSLDRSPPVLGGTRPVLSTLTQHPFDRSIVLSQQNFSGDAESELSSLSDGIPEEDYNEITETLRLGNVEAVSTPPPTDSPRRASGHVALIDDMTSRTARAASSSNLALPHTGLTRSSFLTIDSGGSRISGLSAFPRPPSELVSYFAREAEDEMPELFAAPQNPTHATIENEEEWTHAL